VWRAEGLYTTSRSGVNLHQLGQIIHQVKVGPLGPLFFTPKSSDLASFLLQVVYMIGFLHLHHLLGCSNKFVQTLRRMTKHMYG
jgi:hypothetical protein